MTKTAWKPVGPDTPRDRPIQVKSARGYPINVIWANNNIYDEWDVYPVKKDGGWARIILNPTEWAEIPE